MMQAQQQIANTGCVLFLFGFLSSFAFYCFYTDTLLKLIAVLGPA